VNKIVELQERFLMLEEKLRELEVQTCNGDGILKVKVQGLKETESEVHGESVHFVDTTENVVLSAHKVCPEWILDSGASKHVTGSLKEFKLYDQYSVTSNQTMQTADGTAQPIKGVGLVQCTPTIQLSSVLHVPAFPINLVSLGALIDQLDCLITLDKGMCLIQERLSGRRIGSGTRHRGLWYLDREGLGQTVNSGLTVVSEGKEVMAMIHHCRMGHVSFDKMYKAFPEVMSGVDRNKLKCDACEYAKHTRISYVSKGLRSISPFMLIHSDVWKSPVVSVSGMKYFVTFIYCYSRMTWVYLLRHKDEVFKCFQSFFAYVETQFKVKIQLIRTDNGTEYVNKTFGSFLSEKGILHQTSCPDTPPQNGVAERKN
jgi:hypothetical protein